MRGGATPGCNATRNFQNFLQKSFEKISKICNTHIIKDSLMDSFDKLCNTRKKARQYSLFCDDGILDNKKWQNSSKIMFLLKETYTHWIKIRESGAQGPDGTSKTFWRRMRIWTYVIDEIVHGNKSNFKKALEIKEEPNDSIAYVNIKKLAEKSEYNSEAYSSDADILKYAISDKEFLLKQIELISPRIIICSGTFKFCAEIFGAIEKICERIYKANKLYLIDFYHLSSRNSYEKEFNELQYIMNEYCRHNK
jgi:hypothetical protein